MTATPNTDAATASTGRMPSLLRGARPAARRLGGALWRASLRSRAAPWSVVVTSWPQDIAAAALRLDEPSGVVVDLAPQRAHVDLDEVGVVLVEPPHQREQPRLGEHLARRAGQRGEQVELCACQRQQAT